MQHLLLLYFFKKHMTTIFNLTPLLSSQFLLALVSWRNYSESLDKDLPRQIYTLFVIIFALSRKKSICEQKLVQNLRWKRLCAKIISFHLIHFESFQKLLFWFKVNMYFFIRFKKNWHAPKLIRAKKTYIAVARKLLHVKKIFLRCSKINTCEN